jgi:PPOX class probable F420-dependent enzyme
MASIDDVRELAGSEQGLCVVAAPRRDGTVHASVINAGVMDHPLSGETVVGFVVRDQAHKVNLIRSHGRASITYRRAWRWVGIEGPAEVIDRDEPPTGIDYPQLLRQIFMAAGGTHDDWDTFDRVMAQERRLAVFVAPERILSNR